MTEANTRRLFFTILLGYLALGALYARFTPAWQTPDEPAHYNYVRQVVAAGCCPRIEPGDWSSAYLSQLTSGRFAPELLGELDTLQYEDHHPPLYYLLASLVFRLSAGDLVALRLFSLALGAGAVACSYLVCRRVLPQKPELALGAMALVAFLPQHLHMMSAMNNDALAELLVGLALLWILRYLDGGGATWQLGALAGLAFLCKLTVYFLALPGLLAIWLRWRSSKAPRLELLRSLATFALVAGLIGGIWWLRNISVYGAPDFLGLAAHDAVVADQPRSADYIAEHGPLAYAQQMAATTFKSFWGQFGWMALPLDDALGGLIYPGFGLLSLAGLSGALLAARRRDIAPSSWMPLLLTIGCVALQFGYYNLEFQQWQGRYLFPALIPIAFALSYGMDYWLERLLPNDRRRRWLLPMAMLGLGVLDFVLLFRVIAPGLSPG